VYRLAGYSRARLEAENRCPGSVVSEVKTSACLLSVISALILAPWFWGAQALTWLLTAVLEHKARRSAIGALAHAAEADFHDRRGFLAGNCRVRRSERAV